MALIDDLVSYWKLDEASGTRIDSHGSNDLTDNNTVTQTGGKLGGAAQFASANSESLSIADNASLSAGDIDFTIVGWINLSVDTGSRALIGKYDYSISQREYLLWYNSGTFTFQVSPDGTAEASIVSSLGPPAVGTWYLVIAWHDSVNNTLNIQVDNGAIDSVAHTTGVFNGTSSFAMGQIANAFYYDGLIDETGLWKRVLSADERTELFNDGNGLAYPFGEAMGPPAVSVYTKPNHLRPRIYSPGNAR